MYLSEIIDIFVFYPGVVVQGSVMIETKQGKVLEDCNYNYLNLCYNI
jgi:hypothetical protein